MNRLTKLFPILLLLCLGLSGCGDKKPTPPEAYTIGEDSAPPLDSQLSEDNGTLVSIETGADDSEETDKSDTADASEDDQDASSEEDNAPSGPVTYTYEELSSGADTVKAYAASLAAPEEGFEVISDKAPDYSQSEGAVTLAKASASAGHLFQLDMSWSETGCTVTVSQPEGAMPVAEEEVEPLTFESAVSMVYAADPVKLGLSGNMSDYSVIPNQGLVEVDGQEALRLSVYSKTPEGTNKFAGSYLLTADQKHLYRIEDGQNVTEVPLK